MNIQPINAYSVNYKSIKAKPVHKQAATYNMTSAINNTVSFAGIYTKGIDLVSKSKFSPLELARLQYKPKLPPVFAKGILALGIATGAATEAVSNKEEISELFPKTYGQPIITFSNSGERQVAKPHKVGIILSGGQASGGHNVITGIYDALKQANKNTQIYGFLNGPKGLMEGKYMELNDKIIDNYRNQGGFSMIGSGRDKIETEDQFKSVLDSCKKLGIDAITIIGGDDSNTNSAVLAEWLAQKGEKISVIGCPKTIDGDLKNEQIEASFGFDTATKTYSETVGNIQSDAISAKKYWHFIKVMGRSASHVALEIAHQTHPNITLISEEIEQKNMTLNDVVSNIANTVAKRAEQGKNYGSIVIPEGVVEFIPEFKNMISDLDKTLPKTEARDGYQQLQMSEKVKLAEKDLSESSAKLFSTLPDNIKGQLITEKRDAHGNFPLSVLETDKLLIDMVKNKLAEMKSEGKYSGKFGALSQFCGYEGRAGLPSNFDADYCYSLGYSAATLINSGKTGYMATVSNLSKSPDKWQAGGTPITMMMNMEERNGKMKPVIQKALVDLNGSTFKEFAKNREAWAVEDDYNNPGPIQFYGPFAETKTKTITIEHS